MARPNATLTGTWMTAGLDWEPVPVPEPPADAPVEPPAAQDDRYAVEALLGRGGLGEVWRVHDRVLDRTVALKVLHIEPDARALERFREEAVLAAGLQHPAIVAVHDLGRLPDGRLFFTMREVRGRTLREVAAEVHGQATTAQLGPALRRLVELLHRVCQGVACAHDLGVIHRDLKPSNIMVGAYGDVQVLDWGLARSLELLRGGRAGVVAGTPAYMAPEQARGEVDRIGPPSDVYALGATLYQLLTDSVPFGEGTIREVLELVAAGRLPEAPSARRSDLALPEDLEQICLRAMNPVPEGRYPDAGVLADEIGAWLDGQRGRERALELVERSDRVRRVADALSTEAEALQGESSRRLGALDAHSEPSDREVTWDLEDRARDTARRAREQHGEATRLLHSALSHAPELHEAHDRLADRLVAVHRAHEAEGRFEQADQLAPQIRTHHRGRYQRYLAGTGALTLHTREPTEAALYRLVERRRRLEPVLERALGPTPLVEVPVEMGTYVVRLTAPGRPPVHYPIRIGRQQHWDGVPPAGTEPQALTIPHLGPGECYVPAGWFWSSADLPQLLDPVPRRRVWAHGFVMAEHPVTNAQYAAFLDDLIDQGREDDALAAQPCQRAVAAAADRLPIFQRDEQGHFRVGRDAQGHLRLPDHPVTEIDFASAQAYAAWVAERTGQPWRLPFELEWEKAARGVDERSYPWGHRYDITQARSRASWTREPGPAPVGQPAGDRSPYGVHGLGGNVLTWTQDPRPGGMAVTDGRIDTTRTHEAPMRWARGGSWNHNPWSCRCDVRKRLPARAVIEYCGLRLVRPLP